MARLARWIWTALALLLVMTVCAAAVPRFGLDLLGPHTARAATAVLDPALARAIETNLAKAPPATVEVAVDFALAVTDKLLHFGLEHATSTAFAATDREARPVEYAELFATAFNRAAVSGNLPAKAYVVHTFEPRLFGRKVPFKDFQEHDWVVVDDRSGDKGEVRRWYVDPTLHDAHLGWDIGSNVRGAVKLTR